MVSCGSSEPPILKPARPPPQTELHVWQIMRKGDRGAIEKDLADIKAGASFEEVARSKFPGLDENAKNPADHGYLSRRQIPEEWRDVV